MNAAVGALPLAAILAGCSSSPESSDTLPPVGTVTAVVAPTATAGPAVSGPVGAGVVQVTVRLSGISEQLVLDRSTVAAAELDPITLDATCTAIDGGDGFAVSVVDVRRLTAGQQLVSATLRVTDETGAIVAGEHAAQLELGTAQQETTRFEGVMVLDAGLASGTFDLATGNGATASGSFACGQDMASLPTTTTVPAVVATDQPVLDVSLPDVTVPVVTIPALTVPLATS